jgi:hypothetical protein
MGWDVLDWSGSGYGQVEILVNAIMNVQVS